MTIANDSTPDADEVLRITKIDQVYTGADYDSTGAENTHELTAVTSTDLVNANFAVITFVGSVGSSGAGAGGNVQVKAQIKETGQSYADIVAYKTIWRRDSGAGVDIQGTQTYKLVATLTAGMKTNGFQIKLFSQVIDVGTGSFTNIQTVLEVKP